MLYQSTKPANQVSTHQGLEGAGVTGTVFDRLEQRLAERVVIAHPGAVGGGQNVVGIEEVHQGGGLHGSAVVGVNEGWAGRVVTAGTLEQFPGMFAVFAVVDGLPDHRTIEDVHDDVGVEP